MQITKVFKLFSKLPIYYFQRQFGVSKKLPTNLTLNVSFRCNSHCKTCRITTRKVKELDLPEWKKIFKNYHSKVFWLILSGGEPFLKKDIVELAILGYKYLQPEVINIPTNGFFTEIVPGKVEAILKGCPDSEIVINFSMDGVGRDHDFIRGLPGNFKRLMETYKKVMKLKTRYPNLTVGIHTVISVFNVSKIPQVCDYALSLKPDQYLTEVAERRVELCTTELNITPKPADYKKAVNYISKRLVEERVGGLSKFTTALRLEYYKMVKLILVKKTQVIPCFAGTISGQISAEGEIWPCCVRADNMGNLKDNNYDFAKIWFSPQAQKIKKSIKRKECYCPLASATYTNMLFNFKTGYNITSHVLNFDRKENSIK
jgi:MoaA/NifB/PqqE/SkfB family radical SAM enzyme